MSSELIIFLIIVIVVLLLLTVLGIFVYSGGLHTPTVTIGEPPVKSCQIAYKFVTGDYSGGDVGAAFTEVTSIAPEWRCLGIFYDNDKVPVERRRCAVGCVVPEKSTEDETQANYWETTKKLLDDNHFFYFDLPAVDRAVLSSFPYTTPFSLWIAPTRVYPYMHEFMQMKSLCAYPMIEVYQGCQVQYFTPLSKQDDFLVPEAIAAANNISEKSSDSGSGSESEDQSDLDTTESTIPSLNESGVEQRRVHRRKKTKDADLTDETDSKPELGEWVQVETVECTSLDAPKADKTE